MSKAKTNTSRIIDSKWKIIAYDPMNFFLYLLFGGEKKFRNEIIDHAELSEGMSVLDIGCATGGNSIAILNNNAGFHRLKVYGLDAAFNMVKASKNKMPYKDMSCNFIQAVAERLPFKDNSIERIINVFMLHHMKYEVKVMALKEMFRVLRKRGVLIVIDPTKPYNLFGKALGFIRSYIPEIRDSLKVPLADLVKEGGFKDVDNFKNALGCFSFVRAVK